MLKPEVDELGVAIADKRQGAKSDKERGRGERQLPASQRPLAQMLGQPCDLLQELKDEAEERMLTKAKKHALTKILATAPAIGPIRAAQSLAVVVTPLRARAEVGRATREERRHA